MMDLQHFLSDIQASVDARVEDGTPFEQRAFFDIATEHMAEHGITSDPEACHFDGRIGRSKHSMCGFSISPQEDRLDVFVDAYRGHSTLQSIEIAELKKLANQCVDLLGLCLSGEASDKVDPSQEFHGFAKKINAIFSDLAQVRIFVLTDAVSKEKNFASRPMKISEGKELSVKLEVFDIERLHRHWVEGAPRSEIIADFEDLCGQPIPCAMQPNPSEDFDCALAWIPAAALHALYEAHGDRLLESNVRSFLSIKGKGVNKGIQSTILTNPSDFSAYNNGLVILADQMTLKTLEGGGHGIAGLKGLQIVNGGQTSASVYFTKTKFKHDANLDKVMITAKIIIPKSTNPSINRCLASGVSKFANTQNAVRTSDLSANNPFHIEIEKHSSAVFCPDGVGRWFYERASGSYNTVFLRHGNTPAKKRKLMLSIAPSRKVNKTELAKTLNSWSQRPDFASLGSQKNFDKFMAGLSAAEQAPSVADYKHMIAKTIVFRETQKIVRGFAESFQANVTNYTFSILASKIGGELKLEKIWERQCSGEHHGLSKQLLAQIKIWALQVDEKLRASAGAMMISEWAKKPECKAKMLSMEYSPASLKIPEML